MKHLVSVRPTPGISDSVHHIYLAARAVPTGVPTDQIEADRVAWISVADVKTMIGRGEISSGTTVAALLYAGLGESEPTR